MLTCVKCKASISEPYYLRADSKTWHEDCLRCECCEARLAELGNIYYSRANQTFCQKDYLRIFGMPGQCAMCKLNIQPYEYVMRAQSNVYHLNCFFCQRCQQKFCVGDKYYLCANTIFCENDYLDLIKSNCTWVHNGALTEPGENTSISGDSNYPLSHLQKLSSQNLDAKRSSPAGLAMKTPHLNSMLFSDISNLHLKDLLVAENANISGKQDDNSSSGYDSPSPMINS